MTLTFEVTELHRRLANLIRLGRVIAADYAGDIPRLRIRIGELETAWLPVMTSRAGGDNCWWPVEIGEQVLVLSPSGDLAQGVVLGSLHQQAYPAPGHAVHVHRVVYGDGAVIEYDRKAHALKAVLPAGATTQLVSPGGVHIVGDVEVEGHIRASGDITDHTRSMQADRDIYNGHSHPGVVSGPSSTGTPDQTQ